MAQRLTALEASFLQLERASAPMHVAGLLVVDASGLAGGPVTMRELRRLVVSRLRLLPRFHHIVRFGRTGTAEWIEIAHLDLDAHLIHHRLPAPGSRAQLTELGARIHEELLPRERPLWQIHLIDGLAGHEQALIVKTHHSITDGIAGVEVAEVLFDRGDKAPDSRSNGHEPGRVPGSDGTPWLHAFQGALGVTALLASGPVAADSPFNGPVGRHRSFAMAALPMDEIRTAKHHLGGSVDDLLLGIVSAGLGRYFRQHRWPVTGRRLRAMLPVSTRPPTNRPQLGNHVTSVFVDLPLDERDLGACVRRIAASKSELRSLHEANGVAIMLEAAGKLPAALHSAVVRRVGGMALANLVLSDVPGPDEPLFFLGRRIQACYPMMPLPPSVGLSIASVSMGGVMGVGVTVDPDIVPDPERLAGHIERAFADSRPSWTSEATANR